MSEQRLGRVCNRFRGRLRRLLLEYGAYRSAFLVLAAAAVMMILDWHFRFSPQGRLLSLLGCLSVTGLCYYLDFHRPLRGTWNDTQVLGYMDRVAAESRDALTTLRDLSHPENMHECDTPEGRRIVDSVVEDLERSVDRINVERVLEGRPVSRWRRLAMVVLALYAVSFFVPRDSLSGSSYLSIGARRILLPWASVYWPQDTRLMVVEPESGWRVPKGEPLLITTRIEGEVPPIVNIVYKGKKVDKWITERMAVNPSDAAATFTFGEMTEPMTFYCRGGDDYEERTYHVTVAERPMLTQISALYRYPKHTMMSPETRKDGQLAAIEGTTVKLDFTASADLASAAITVELGGEKPETIPIENIDGNRFSHELTMKENGRYTVELTDTEHLENGKVERYEISVLPDNPPEIEMVKPVGDVELTPRGTVAVEFHAKDDFNLEELSVMLAPVGGKGRPLSDVITGHFWNVESALHTVGNGKFILDFQKELERGTLDDFKVEKGAELELWVLAVDSNPDGSGRTESLKARLLVKNPTDFMEGVLLKAKAIRNDAKIGWHAQAGAYHDGKKFIASPENDKLLDNVLDQQERAANTAAALKKRVPTLLDCMKQNRMEDVFMSKRLNRIGTKANELTELLPAIAAGIEEGRPGSVEEEQPEKRRAKMAAALAKVSDRQNRAAWQMGIFHSWFADWVALQSVLLKTRRMEELQRETNSATDSIVSRTLGREAIELEEDEVREMREAANQQQTIHDMHEAVEKELNELILETLEEKRMRMHNVLLTTLKILREGRVGFKLQRAAIAIGDARGDTVRRDQKFVLDALESVNHGLIAAGEEVPGDLDENTLARETPEPGKGGKIDNPPDDDPNGGGPDEPEGPLPPPTPPLDGPTGPLQKTLAKVFDRQEDIRNRTSHVSVKLSPSERYMLLRTGLTALRQTDVAGLLDGAVRQAKEYRTPDPDVELTRERLAGQIGDYRDAASDAAKLLHESDFGELTTGIQHHVHRGAHDLRTYIQETERMYKLQDEHAEAGHKDSFGRPYRFREDNLGVMARVAKDLHWAMAMQEAAVRESQLLAKADTMKKHSAIRRTAIARLKQSARAKNSEIASLIGKMQETTSTGVTDPDDPEREREQVRPLLRENLQQPLALEHFQGVLEQFDRGEYGQLAVKQESLRQTLFGSLLALRGMFHEYVPLKAPPKIPDVPDIPDIIDPDRDPKVVADWIEKHGEWLDVRTGSPALRKSLIEKLRGMKEFDVRYWRVQSAYLKHLGQGFQPKSKEYTQEDIGPEE